MTDTTTMYFTFDDSKLSTNPPNPDSFYVAGRVHDGIFVPQSEIMGAATFSEVGELGWVELASGQFYPTQTPRTPTSPYVEGRLTKNGFVPSSREIK